MSNYAIEILEQKLEDEKALYDKCVTSEMKRVYESDIEDLQTAIHNLKMLEF